MKRSFSQEVTVLILLYGYTTWTLTKRLGEKAWQQLHKNAASNTEQVLEATPHKVASRKLSKLGEQDMQDIAGEIGTSSKVMYSYGPLHMAVQMQGG